MGIEIATSPESLTPYAEMWDKLATESSHPLPVTSYSWVRCEFERGYHRGKPWVCLLAQTDKRLTGVLPVFLERSRWVPWRYMTARVPFTWHTSVCDLAVANGEEREVVLLLLDGLRQAVPGFSRLTLERAPVDSPILRCFDRPNGRFCVVKQFNLNAAYLPIIGDFETYLESLHKKFRTNVHRWQRKINQLAGLEYVSIFGNQATEKHLMDFTEMEASGWKGREGSAIQASPEVVEFYRKMTDRLAERGWLQWHFLRAEGKTIAGQLGTQIGRSLVLLKIAFREEYSAFAPGNVLLARTIEQAFASGDVDEINCLTDFPWTQNWNMQLRPHYKIDVYPKALAPMLLGALPSRARIAGSRIPWLTKSYRAFRRLLEALNFKI